jgi:hypothetical protein
MFCPEFTEAKNLVRIVITGVRIHDNGIIECILGKLESLVDKDKK